MGVASAEGLQTFWWPAAVPLMSRCMATCFRSDSKAITPSPGNSLHRLVAARGRARRYRDLFRTGPHQDRQDRCVRLKAPSGEHGEQVCIGFPSVLTCSPGWRFGSLSGVVFPGQDFFRRGTGCGSIDGACGPDVRIGSLVGEASAITTCPRGKDLPTKSNGDVGPSSILATHTGKRRRGGGRAPTLPSSGLPTASSCALRVGIESLGFC